MTDVLSVFVYPHWLLVAGAILVVIGLVGIAFRQTKADLKPTEVAHESDWARADRKAQLAERTRNRWANEAGEGS
jgi:hypothetical protein